MNLYSLTLHETRDLIKSKAVSSYDVTSAYISRIESVDKKVNSFIYENFDNALKMAEITDKKILNNESTGKLAGIPYGLKDNIVTKNIKTTCASRMLENYIPPYDSTVTEKLNTQGGILLGKLNMDEFAMGATTENSAFKITKNPYDLTKNPGGSSGGSAAAVSADEVCFSLGTDTGGSIRQPASFCGCVGLKPTYGRVSRHGLVSFASSLDHIGPITKDVKDAAIILDVISGFDANDATSAPFSSTTCENSLNENIKNIKIGIPVQYFDGITKEVSRFVFAAIKNLEHLGALCNETSSRMYEYSLAAYYLISSGEASSNLARYDGIKYGFCAEDFENLDDLYKTTRGQGFGKEVKRRIMLGTYILSSSNYNKYYNKAQKVRTMIKDEFSKLFEKYDVLLTPAYPTTTFELGKNATSIEMYAGGNCLVGANLAGLPAVVLPCGYDIFGLPVGVQIIGKPFDEATVLNVAYALEKTITKIKPSLMGGAE